MVLVLRDLASLRVRVTARRCGVMLAKFKHSTKYSLLVRLVGDQQPLPCRISSVVGRWVRICNSPTVRSRPPYLSENKVSKVNGIAVCDN